MRPVAAPESVRSFERFAERKTRAAEQADIGLLRTLIDHSASYPLRAVANDWTLKHYDGLFHLSDELSGLPAISLVFVQSRDGNTAADNPADLGGGDTDTHLLYEGLSRVAADAVLAGSTTARGPDVFFSVWHPELVALRHALKLPRHPAQIVISEHGNLDLENGLLFNLPEMPVFVMVAKEALTRCASAFDERPWITVVPLQDDLQISFSRLRAEHGFSRISLVGGRHTATTLIDAGLVQDLYLTTTSSDAGEPQTPFYIGTRPLESDVVVRKEGMGAHAPIVFEHVMLRRRAAG